jgi:hypothetical protein
MRAVGQAAISAGLGVSVPTRAMTGTFIFSAGVVSDLIGMLSASRTTTSTGSASNTGDLAEATEFAGLTEDQVAIVLPKLRVFLGSLVERPML